MSRRLIWSLLLTLFNVAALNGQSAADDDPLHLLQQASSAERTDRPAGGDTETRHELFGVIQGNFGEETPFWLQQNRYDMVPRDPGLVSGALYRGVRNLNENWRLNWGTELQARSDHRIGESWLPQIWAGISRGNWQLSAGRWRQTVGMVQQEISAGASIWSPNSRPMSKVKLELTDFTALPLTDGWFSIKGGLAHGWFEGERQVQDFWLHEKYLFGKLGRRGTPELYGGLIHMAQWGGYDTNRYGQIPSGVHDYWRVFFGMSGGEGSPDQFQVNRFGNSLGSWQAGVIWRFEPVEVWLHKETIFEDSSGFKLRSPEDGVQGINLLFRHRPGGSAGREGILSSGTPHLRDGPGIFSDRAGQVREPVTKLTWEFWHTKSQSGPGPADRPPDWDGNRDEHGNLFGGRDDYFNHGVYIEGWSYRDRLIGVPLITFDAERQRVTNNRMIAHHLAVVHDARNSRFSASWTWSRNYGTYDDPFEKTLEQTYVKLGWEHSLQQLTDLPLMVRLELGLDVGDHLGTRSGGLLSLGYRFL